MKYFVLFLTLCGLVGVFFHFEEKASDFSEKNIFSSQAAIDYLTSQGYPAPKNAQDAMEENRQLIAEMRKTCDLVMVERMFVGADLKKAYLEFLHGWIPSYEGGSFPDYLQNSLRILKDNPQVKKTKTTLSNDSYQEGNFPFLQFTLPNSEKTKVIRMGLPMIEAPYLKSLWSAPLLNPEFLVFLRSRARHLYVNLMKREGLEGPSSHSLEGYDVKEPSLAVVTLDKNSDFYWQKGEFPETAIEFKRLFYKKMQDPKGDFYWSSKLEKKQLEETIHAIMEKVHQGYFSGKDFFNLQERLDFIELTYLEILDFLVEALRPESMNITCKHAIDRGPSLAVLWQCKVRDISYDETAALLLAPPLLMHNRTSHASRIERFSSAWTKIEERK